MQPFIPVTICLIFLLGHVQAQTDVCHLTASGNITDSYACVGRALFRECSEPADSPPQFCNIMSGVSNAVCYGGVNDSNICGSPPPACTAVGNFPIDNRCRNFYTCVSTGSRLVQYISECESGFEYSKTNRSCINILEANCSILLTTTASPSTTPSLTTPRPSNLTTTPSTGTTSSAFCPPFSQYPDPTSCYHYYQCFFFGRRIRLACPFGWLYDTQRRTCGRTANCGNRPL